MTSTPSLVPPHVRLRVGPSTEVLAGPGAILGRLESAAVVIQDPRVSEAHALVSLRGRHLHLLALRGALTVDGEPTDDVVLEPEQHIGLGDGPVVHVVAVCVPMDVLAVRVDGEAPRELCAPVYSLCRGVPIELVPRAEPEALVRIWSTAEGWAAEASGRVRALRPGDRLTEGSAELTFEVIPVTSTSAPTAAGTRALELRIRHPVVHVRQPGRRPEVLDGQTARVVSALAAFGVPVDWQVLAAELWNDSAERHVWRKRWDRSLTRLRLRLRELGIRDDLVRSDGWGNVELFLHAHDRVVDEEDPDRVG